MQESENRLKPSGNHEDEQQKLSSLLEATDSGISAEEHNSILSQIDRMFDGGAAIENVEELSYQPKKNGSLFPVLTSIAVILLTVTAVLLLFVLHYKQEQSMLNQGGTIYSTEGTILREYRRETEQKLALGEGELQNIRYELTALEQEHEVLIAQTEQLIKQYNQEFENELQARIEKERARLEISGISRTVIEERIEKYRKELTAQHAQKLAEISAEAEQKLKQQKQQIEHLSKSYENRIKEYEGDREAALRDLTNIQERQQEAHLLSEQISSAYLSAVSAIENDNFQASRQSLGVVGELLALDSVRSVPVTARRLPADQKILSALSQFVNLKESRLADQAASLSYPQIEELGKTILQQKDELQMKDESIAALTESISQLTAQLQSTRSDLSQTRSQLEPARRELQILRAVKNSFSAQAKHFHTLAEKLSGSPDMQHSEQANQEVLAALSNKLEILEIIKSETVRRQYPDMEKLFIRYLDTFELEYQRLGYLEALKDAHKLIESVNTTGKPAEGYSFRRDRNTLLQAVQLIEELELLVTP